MSSPIDFEKGQFLASTRIGEPLSVKTGFSLDVFDVHGNKKVQGLFYTVLFEKFFQNDPKLISYDMLKQSAKNGAKIYASRADAISYLFFQDTPKSIGSFVHVDRLLLGRLAENQDAIDSFAPQMKELSNEVTKRIKVLNSLFVSKAQKEKLTTEITVLDRKVSPLLDAVVMANRNISDIKRYIGELHKILDEALLERVHIVYTKTVKRNWQKDLLVQTLSSEFTKAIQDKKAPYVLISYVAQNPEKIHTVALNVLELLAYDSRYGAMKYENEKDMHEDLVRYVTVRDFESVTVQTYRLEPAKRAQE